MSKFKDPVRVGDVFLTVSRGGKVKSGKRVIAREWGAYETVDLKKRELAELLAKMKGAR